MPLNTGVPRAAGKFLNTKESKKRVLIRFFFLLFPLRMLVAEKYNNRLNRIIRQLLKINAHRVSFFQ